MESKAVYLDIEDDNEDGTVLMVRIRGTDKHFMIDIDDYLLAEEAEGNYTRRDMRSVLESVIRYIDMSDHSHSIEPTQGPASAPDLGPNLGGQPEPKSRQEPSLGQGQPLPASQPAAPQLAPEAHDDHSAGHNIKDIVQDIDDEFLESLTRKGSPLADHPFLVNNDAKIDGSILTEEKIRKYLGYYDKYPEHRGELIVKFSGATIRDLLKYKESIPQNIRRAIVTYIIGKDGANSSFVPAELGSFMDEDISLKPLGVSLKSTQGIIPDGFDESLEESGFSALLNERMNPGYVPLSTKVPWDSEKKD